MTSFDQTPNTNSHKCLMRRSKVDASHMHFCLAYVSFLFLVASKIEDAQLANQTSLSSDQPIRVTAA